MASTTGSNAAAPWSPTDQEDTLSEWSLVQSPVRSLRVEASLERVVAAAGAHDLQAVLSVLAPVAAEDARAPLRLVAILDKSGSMHGEKLRLVRETMLFTLQHLSNRDALGIVVYDTQVRVAAPLTLCDSQGRANLERALKRLEAGSQTNLSGGLLRGLDLHHHGVQRALAEEPLQTVRIGNSYRRLTLEEIPAEHFGYPGATPPDGNTREHEWTMELRFGCEEDEALVEKVVYGLHETFRHPVVEVTEAPFKLTRHGWGFFEVRVAIHLKDGRVLKLTHELSFRAPETFRAVLLPLRSPPAGLDYFVNGVKKVRVTSLELGQGAESLRNPCTRGRTLHLDGVSYGDWTPARRTTVPDGQPELAEEVMALFHGRSSEASVEFTDTDGDRIRFLVSAPLAACSWADAEAQELAAVRSAFLFTDGHANVGITKLEDLCAAAEGVLGELGERRCTLSTFGFGKDHNADLLQRLAEIGSGIYSYVEDKDKIGEAFGEALGGLLSTTHQNVCLSLDVAAGVGVPQVHTTYDVDGPTDGPDGTKTFRVNVGDLFAEERRDVLVTLSLPEAEVDGSQVLATVSARGFSVLGTRTETTELLRLGVERRGDAATGSCHPQVERHRNRLTATKALEEGRAAAQRGNLVSARQLLSQAIDILGRSELTQSGDSLCVGLLADLNDCLKDLRHEEDYRMYGSKKMAFMQGAHQKQRACFGQEGSTEAYSNIQMSSMKAAFKSRVG